MDQNLNIGDVDKAFEALGPLGKYCRVQLGLGYVALWTVVFQNFIIVFTGMDNPFKCNSENLLNLSKTTFSNSTNFGSSCDITLFVENITNSSESSRHTYSCSPHELVYEKPEDFSFVSEFDLECDNSFLKGMTQTIYSAGFVLGCFIVPYFTDTYGRRPVILVSTALITGMSIASALSVNFLMYAVLKFVMGFLNSSISTGIVAATMEVLVTRHRSSMFGFVGSMNWTFGMLLMAPIAYSLRHHSWRVLQYAYTAFYIILVFLVFFMDETLRWLTANGRRDRALEVIKRASRWNNRNYDDVVKEFLGNVHTDNEKVINDEIVIPTVTRSNRVSYTTNPHPTDEIPNHSRRRRTRTLSTDGSRVEEENLRFRDLFTDPMLRVHTAFAFFASLFCNQAYLGLTLMSSTLVGSLYLNFVISAIAEIPQAVYILFYLDRVGRRKSLVGFSLIGGFFLLALAALRAFAPHQDVLISVMTFFGKFGVTGTFNVSFTMMSELFPTNLRNSGIGLASVGTGIGGMLAPFAEMFFEAVVYGPGLLFGLTTLLIPIGALYLPETTSRQLPQTLAEMKAWGKEVSGKDGDTRNDDHGRKDKKNEIDEMKV